MYRNVKLAKFIQEYEEIGKGVTEPKIPIDALLKWARENDHPVEAKERNSNGDLVIRFSSHESWIDPFTWKENYRNKILAACKRELRNARALFSQEELGVLLADDNVESSTSGSLPLPREKATTEPTSNQPVSKPIKVEPKPYVPYQYSQTDEEIRNNPEVSKGELKRLELRKIVEDMAKKGNWKPQTISVCRRIVDAKAYTFRRDLIPQIAEAEKMDVKIVAQIANTIQDEYNALTD